MIEKYKIEGILTQISATQNSDGAAVGLLHEESGLGLKRKLRKIQAELLDAYRTLQTDITEVKKIEDPDVKRSEMERLMCETIDLKTEKALLAEIEKIESRFPYDFSLIELISQ